MARLFVLVLTLAALAACGGGGGSSPSAPPPPGATPTPLPTMTILPPPPPTTSTPTPTPQPTVTTAAGVPAWLPTQHHDYVAIAYGGNPPMHVSVYAPGQSVASATITYNSCCIWQMAFDAQANLIMATTNDGVLFYSPGATASPFRKLPAQGGFSLALSAQGDIAVGGYNMGSTIAVYPGGSASLFRLPGQPAFQSLAFSPSGEIAVPQSDGSVQTFARGSTTANRTLPVNLKGGGGVNLAVLAYDGTGNLAVGGGSPPTVGVYAPGATAPAYTISGFGSVQSMAYDSTNRLVVGDTASIKIFAAGSPTLVNTISNNRPVALAVDPDNDIAIAGWTSPSQVFQGNGNVVTINGLFQADSVAISP